MRRYACLLMQSDKLINEKKILTADKEFFPISMYS